MVEGAAVGGGRTVCATVTGPVRGILLGERVGLNILARCSGIATRTRDVVATVRAAGYRGLLAGTRKTTPGFRLVEKYGMLVGGADTHRMDLSAMVMLKDNHVWSRGSIADAVAAAKAVAGFSMRVDVEVQTRPRPTRPSAPAPTSSCWTTSPPTASAPPPGASRTAGPGSATSSSRCPAA